MARKTFLGKPIPSGRASAKPKRSFGSPKVFALLILPIIACGAVLSLQKNTLLSGGIGERSTGNALSLAVADQTSTNILIDSGPAPAAPSPQSFTAFTADFCQNADVEAAFFNGDFSDSTNPEPTSLKNIFPIIPNYINGLDDNGNTIDLASITDASTKYCASPYWTRVVVYCFIYKGLAILNWLAEAIAIIYTIYAGLMYMLGALNEKNVSRAKTILIGTYGGLAIILLARVLLYSTISATVQNNPYQILTPNSNNNLPGGAIPGVNDTPTPSAK